MGEWLMVFELPFPFKARHAVLEPRCHILKSRHALLQTAQHLLLDGFCDRRH
jgi:hypothetical protein